MTDVQILRELAKQYYDITQLPVQNQRREQWTRFHAMSDFQARVYSLRFGVNELFGNVKLHCQD
ncbi:MAG: hypothetical protein RSC98_05230, partial [Clostridia bacterium]